LEVGIQKGGSIKLWSDYFTNAKVYGLDIMKEENVWDPIKNNERIMLYTSTNAYDKKFVETTFVNENIKFDFMLDDGPHNLYSMKRFIALYSPLMAEDGILIIEDVQDFDWFEQLKDETPQHLKPFIKTFDLRKNKNRYDDLVFVIDKSKK
jgi:hypothetical protein